MTLTLFMLVLGTTARVTRFLTSDVLAARARDAVAARFGADGKLYYLVTCPWCAGLWVSTGVTAAAFAATGGGSRPAAGWWTWPAAALTASYVYGLAAQHLDDEA